MCYQAELNFKLKTINLITSINNYKREVLRVIQQNKKLQYLFKIYELRHKLNKF